MPRISANGKKVISILIIIMFVVDVYWHDRFCVFYRCLVGVNMDEKVFFE